MNERFDERIFERRDHTPRDLLRAFVSAHLLSDALAKGGDSTPMPDLVRQAIGEMSERFEDVEDALETAGWETTSLDLITLYSSSSESWLAVW